MQIKFIYSIVYVVLEWTAQEAFLGLWWVQTLESGLSTGILNGKSQLQGPKNASC